MARGSRDRGAVRAQLRGGRRELRPPRGWPVRGLPLRHRRRRAVARAAPLEHGISLRLRRPGRVLAPAPALHGAGAAGDDLRRHLGAGAEPGAGGGDEGGGLGDRLPRAQVGRSPRHARGGRAAPDRRIDPPAHGGRRRATAGLVHRALLDEHGAPGGGDGPARLDLGRVRRRPALLARGGRPGSADDPVHPRGERHALRHGPRLHRRGAVLHLPEGHLRHPLRGGGAGGPADVLRGPPRAPGGASWQARGPPPLPGACDGPRAGLVCAPHRHRAPLGRAPPAPGADSSRPTAPLARCAAAMRCSPRDACLAPPPHPRSARSARSPHWLRLGAPHPLAGPVCLVVDRHPRGPSGDARRSERRRP
jgi:hypothetical protein